MWKVYITERFRLVIEKASILSDIANHITGETANKIFEYITDEFKVNCLSHNDTVGSNIFLLKILKKHYMNKGFSTDRNIIKEIRTMSEICDDTIYSTLYNVPDRLKTNVEIVREALSDLGKWYK